MSEFIELMKRGGNEAIKINKPTGADFHLTARGSDWLFTVFCLFMFFAIILILLMFRKPVNERLFYYTAIAPLLFMSMAYFSMASNLGWTPIQALYNHNRVSTQKTHLGYRQIFYARYIGWFLSLPWIIVQASLLGKTPILQIAFNIGLAELYVVCLLIASLVHSTYKWGYFVFAFAAGVVACVSIMTTTRNSVKRVGGELYNVFTIYMSIVMFLWGVYPIAFGLCEGGNVLVLDSEQIFYGALDVLLYGVCACLFIPLASYIGMDKIGYKFDDVEANNHAAAPAPKPKAAPAKPVTKKSKKAKKSKN